MADVHRHVQFYTWSWKEQRRRLFSFRVRNIQDARRALVRFKVPSGWYVETHKYSGKVITNERIWPDR